MSYYSYYPPIYLTPAQIAAIAAAVQIYQGANFSYYAAYPSGLASLPPEVQIVAAQAAAEAKATEERVRRRRMARGSIQEFPSSMLKSKALRTR